LGENLGGHIGHFLRTGPREEGKKRKDRLAWRSKKLLLTGEKTEKKSNYRLQGKG